MTKQLVKFLFVVFNYGKNRHFYVDQYWKYVDPYQFIITTKIVKCNLIFDMYFCFVHYLNLNKDQTNHDILS